jgi:D-alanyl-D-alanine carboxypeptidase
MSGGCAAAQELVPEEQQSPQWTYPVSLEALNQDYVRLVNQDNLLPSDYVPEDLVKIKAKKTSSTPIQMREIASTALSEMFAAALNDGITLYAHSGYRSYQTQKTMYYNRLEQNGGKDDGVVALPGASDHQTGLGIDVISKEWIGKKFNPDFADTPEAQWMHDHCAEFGYVIRYPMDKGDITGIIFEPWHLRYVGVEAAAYIMGKSMVLEEFTAEWQQALADFEGAGGIAQQTITSPDAAQGDPQQATAEEQLPEEGSEGPVTLELVGADGDPEVTLFH